MNSKQFAGFTRQFNVFKNPRTKLREWMLDNQYIQGLRWDKPIDRLTADVRAWMAVLEDKTDVVTNTVEEWHPLAFAAKANAEDTLTWHEAMNGPNKSGFLEAAVKEIDVLCKMNVWDVVDRAPWMTVVPSTWAFRIKRFPSGEIKKLKSRFCVAGNRQPEPEDPHSTYCPVVKWTTIRLMLILSVIENLESVQCDFTAAFVHAPIHRPDGYEHMTPEEQARSEVYISMPRGFEQAGKVLRLNKSLYGMRESPRNFYRFLRGNLEKVGFTCMEDIDPCLFVSDKVVCITYVDDNLYWSRKRSDIDEVLEKLRNLDMTLEIEDDVAGFLGVLIKKTPDGKITLTQEGLARRIVEALNIEHLPKVDTPAIGPLVKDDDGEPAHGTYNYSSVVGMLTYYVGHSRTELSFAASQVCRYVHAPKRSHEIALERIGQYIKGTLDKGLVLNPSDNLDIDCYVDADFAGLWPHEVKTDPSCVKSRTGFVICVANCPVVWSSKLQSDIATSTMMAEYTALSVAMKEVLPIQDLCKVLYKALGKDDNLVTNFKTTIHEDNNGALILAQLEPGHHTPASRFYAIRLHHWFRSLLKPKKISVKRIDTNEQRADILTKALSSQKFRELRLLLCGW